MMSEPSLALLHSPVNRSSIPSLTLPQSTPCTHLTAPSTSSFHVSFTVSTTLGLAATYLGGATGSSTGSTSEFKRKACCLSRRACCAR